MFDDFARLISQFSTIIMQFTSAGYLLGYVALLIVVCLNLKLSGWMWYILAGLAGRIMVTAMYFFVHLGGSGTSGVMTWMALLQLVGLASYLLEIVGTAGLIHSFRRKFQVIDHSAWTQP